MPSLDSTGTEDNHVQINAGRIPTLYSDIAGWSWRSIPFENTWKLQTKEFPAAIFFLWRKARVFEETGLHNSIQDGGQAKLFDCV